MATYVYECDGCGKVFEVQQRMTEPALTDCIDGCGGKVKRIIQAPMLIAGTGRLESAPARPTRGFS